MTQVNPPGWHNVVSENLLGGNADKLKIHLESITIGGTELKLPAEGVTAIVGGNNVGKSTVLRDLVNLLHRQLGVEPFDWRLVDEVKLHKQGDAADLLAWLDRHATFVPRPDPGNAGFVRLNQTQPTHPATAASLWTQCGPTRLDRLGPFLVHYSDALSRSDMVQGTPQRDNIADPPSHPLHHLEDDSQLMREVSKVCEAIFRQPLTLDRLGARTYLRVGTPTVEAPPIDAVTSDYRSALTSLRLLEAQGDGMKSLIGLLLPVLTAVFPVVVIDEPEAFLHPPQARELGQRLATIAQDRGIQVILATHDRNLLTGLLEPNAPVSVVRLDRRGDQTIASQLDHTAVQKLWTDPVMRYSNVLDGLFHQVVVVAEGDPDCRFYAAALDTANAKQPLDVPPSEIHFVPANGKGGMPKIVEALSAVHVRVVATPDLDLLDDKNNVRRLVEAFNKNWQPLEDDYAVATEAFRSAAVVATCGDVLAGVEAVLKPIASEPWDETAYDKVRPHLRTSRSKWRDLKTFGMRAFKGQAAVRADALLAALEDVGICCVRDGELEGMAPTLGISKGPAWLPAALAANAHAEPPAQEHVARLIKAATK